MSAEHLHPHEHAHTHGGAHAHGHDHGHPYEGGFGAAFMIGTVLNLGFVAIEAFYGIAANSVALLADAGHNLSDVLGLVVAWGAAGLSARSPTRHYTYGFRRSSILAALFNAVFLLLAIGAIAFEAIHRLVDPQPVAGGVVIAVAAAGIAVNGITAWLFASGRKGDLNIRAAFLHMLADAIVSAGVVIAGIVVAATGWLWLDPAASLAIVLVILVGTWGLLRDSLAMSMDRVPAGIVPGEVEAMLAGLPGVAHVHDLHIWPMSTTEVALTCHLVMPAGCPGDAFLHDASELLGARFAIGHATIQIERDEQSACLQAPEEAL